jgi:hypothetical protein
LAALPLLTVVDGSEPILEELVAHQLYHHVTKTVLQPGDGRFFSEAGFRKAAT